jgi:hypothetical protein
MAKAISPFSIAADLGASIIDTSTTLWFRWPILTTSWLPSRNSAELSRMIFEKNGALTAGIIGAQTEAMKIAVGGLFGKQTKDVPSAIAGAAIKPALRTVKANAKRLRRKAMKRTATRR